MGESRAGPIWKVLDTLPEESLIGELGVTKYIISLKDGFCLASGN